MTHKVDAIIVGSGAGGGTAADALTARGLNVVVLEKGEPKKADDFLPYDELHFSEHGALQPGSNDPQTYVDASGKVHKVKKWWVANMVGGSTMVWQATVPRYTDADFSVLKYMKSVPKGSSMVNWPWTYDEFQPYFEKAEREWGVSGKARMSPSQERVRVGYNYPMPPLRAHAMTPFMLEAFDKVSMKPYFSPTAINSRTYHGRPACPYCGYCQGFGCAVNDRASSTNTVLRKAQETGRCQIKHNHFVTRLHHMRGKVAGVFYKTSYDGPEKLMEAPIVIVSIQSIESARLFLLSEIPDPNKMIGHYLTYHTKGSLTVRFKGQNVWDAGPQNIYQPRTAISNLQLRDLYTINDPSTYLTKGGKFTIADPFTTSTPIKLINRSKLWGKDLHDYMMDVRCHAGANFSFTGESLSVYENRVELDPDVKDPWGMPVARTYYQHHPYDLDLSKYVLNRIATIMSDAGGEITAMSPQKAENRGYGHNHGTLRAGKDPGSSVLDENCQSHTVQGLYVLDSAWMPTSGASNPTLTLVANAYRVCDSLKPEPKKAYYEKDSSARTRLSCTT